MLLQIAQTRTVTSIHYSPSFPEAPQDAPGHIFGIVLQAVLSSGEAVTYAAGAVLDEMVSAWRSAEQCVAHACRRWQVPQQLWEDLRSFAGRFPAAADPHTSVLLGQVIHWCAAMLLTQLDVLHLVPICSMHTSTHSDSLRQLPKR